MSVECKAGDLPRGEKGKVCRSDTAVRLGGEFGLCPVTSVSRGIACQRDVADEY